MVLFVEAAIFINSICRPSTAAQCLEKPGVVHIVLLCLSLMQCKQQASLVCLSSRHLLVVVSTVSVLVCFRSLREAYSAEVESPYNALVVGNYKKLPGEPETLSVHSNRDRMQYVLKV